MAEQKMIKKEVDGVIHWSNPPARVVPEFDAGEICCGILELLGPIKDKPLRKEQNMKECEDHNYGKWNLAQFGTVYYGKEIRSCTECGASQVRSIQDLTEKTLPTKTKIE